MVSTRSQTAPSTPRTPSTVVRRSGTTTTRTIAIQQLSTSPSSKPSSPYSPTRLSQPSNESARSSRSANPRWSHTPSRLTLLWLAISLPLVMWDTGYVLLRPWSMPGGVLHSPIWKPYALYGTVDYIYGQPAWDAHNGFTAAQGTLNVVETVGYVMYLFLVLKGDAVAREGRGASLWMGWLGEGRVVRGRLAAWAVVLGLSISVMTVSKTVLYWLNEAFSGFANIGHNGVWELVFLWIIPNGLWIVLPTYMIYVFGAEILEGLEAASGVSVPLTAANEFKDE